MWHPRSISTLYPLQSIHVPSVPEGYADTIPEAALQTLRKKPEHYNIDESTARKAMQAYYASISFADAQVGRILDTLRSAEIDDNTIVVLTSDHGYHMGEHGHWLKTTLFENAARVPLIIAGPGVMASGRSTASLAELTDLYPTLVELAGGSPSPHLSGVSLVPTLKDPSAAPRTSAMTQLKDANYTIRTSRFRYTEWGEAGTGGAELYDHQSDPAEMNNLAEGPKQGDIRERLSKQLRARIDRGRQPPAGVKQVRPVE
jgi:iduronate 2-sulfatase